MNLLMSITFLNTDEPLFHRQKVLNEMIMVASTEIVVNYDCDVILQLILMSLHIMVSRIMFMMLSILMDKGCIRSK